MALIVKRSCIVKHGYDLVFKPLVDDLRILESNGLDVRYLSEWRNIKGTISFVIADNLAANNLAGLVESFGPNVVGIKSNENNRKYFIIDQSFKDIAVFAWRRLLKDKQFLLIMKFPNELLILTLLIWKLMEMASSRTIVSRNLDFSI